MADEQFLALCESIDDARERVLLDQLAGFREGVLAAIFDSLDRIQHMFRRDRPEIVEQWYIRLDALVGRVENELQKSGGKPAKFLVMSDHGFADFGYKVHLNRWLVEKGYLATKDGGGKGLSDVDWSKSAAYAIGLNSLYLNLAGREGRGIVALERVESLVAELKAELKTWVGPNGQQVISRALAKEQAFSGPLTPYGPDIVLGYSSGYRASAETGLGKWGAESIEPNHDHWGADHCIDSQLVPGVLFSKQGLSEYPSPSYRDIPMLVLGREIEHGDVEPPTISGDEGEDVLEERLKGLGYL
jgi:predicted AlkP superfamily phosphohydrolase/phosphomutase